MSGATTTMVLLQLMLTCALVAAYPRPTGKYETKFEGGVTLQMSDNVTLHADGFIPIPKDNATLFPVLVFPNSWGMPQFEYIIKTFDYASYGYIAIEYETRGWYLSGGQIDMAGPRDLEDAAAVLDYVASRQDWRPDTSNMAFIGISYGAGIALSMAGSDSRVKTAVVMSGWANITDAVLRYNTPNKVWGGLLVLLADLVGKPPPALHELYDDILNHKNMSFVRSFCDIRSPIRFLPNLNAKGTPIFMSHNRLDRLFRSDLAIDFFSMLNTSNKFLMVNVGVHAEPEMFGDVDFGKNGIWANAKMWLDHYLMGRETDITQMPPLQMQLGDTMSSKVYLGFRAWPDPAVVDQWYVLNPRGASRFGTMTPVTGDSRLLHADPPDSIAFSMLPGLSPGIPLITGLTRSVGIPLETELLLVPTDTALIWRSPPLSSRSTFCGIPKLNVTVSANSPQWQFYAFLYDVDELDVGRLTSDTYYTHYGDGASTGNATTLYEIKDLPFHQICSDFAAGHRIGVGVVLECDLFQFASTDQLQLSFHYGAFKASMSMPLVPS